MADVTADVAGRTLRLTNLDKVLYPETGTTKGDVIAYYQVVAPYFVPHAAHRPATRKRWPNGVGTPEQPQTPFFHKNLDPKSTPDWVRTFTIEHSEGDNVYPLIDDAATKRRVIATNPATRRDMRDAAHALFARDGKAVSVVRDSGGFVTQRVLAAIVNIAADICQQRICSPKDLETAVTLGLGYPQGPLAMGDRWGPANILEVLFNMQTVYGDPRYRPSPWLRRRGALGLSLTHEEE